MFLTTAFRLSFFLTLGLACACLALAESFFMGWIGYFLVGTLILLVLAYHWQERWVLSADAANRLGMVIAIGAAFWILFKLPRSEEEFLASGVPWPAGLLPHLGPLLILLLLVKVFRPKQFTDFWVIQTIGLMMVTLSCVLAAEPMFGVLLILYLASLFWSLALFYLVRGEARSRWHEGTTSALDPDSPLLSLFTALEDGPAPPLPWRHLGLIRVAGWTGLVVVLGLGLFLLAPRQDNYQWEPKQLTSAGKGLLKTGSGDSGMDLNRVGKVELSQDPAFDVQAMDAHGPKLDLKEDTRWYVQTLDYYAQGRWTSWNQGVAPANLVWGLSSKQDALGSPTEENKSHPRNLPGDLADPEFYLYFRFRLSAAGGLVLAEPITGTRVGINPYMGEKALEAASLFFHQIGTDSVLGNPNRWRQVYQYGQVMRTPANPVRVPAKEVNARYRQFITKQPAIIPLGIADWVRKVLKELPDLTPADGPPDDTSPVPPAAHAKVALALTRYLAYSGEFGYSLDLQRSRRDMDPLADFLLNVKEGHCERFAGGLTLMLRSLGIPARVIKGYRGLEHLGDGKYVVRQSQAHSWVEALVEDDAESNYWLTLDPTPSTERTVKPILSWFGWLFQRWTDGDNIWHNYIMEYNADQQERTLEYLQNQMTPESAWNPILWLLVPGLLVLGGFWALKRQRGRRLMADDSDTAWRAGPARTGFYQRFLEVAHRCLKMQPELGQTPLEFGIQAQACLLNKASGAEGTAIPLQLVALLYRIRFGGQTLTIEEEVDADRQVDRLANMLQAASPPSRVNRQGFTG